MTRSEPRMTLTDRDRSMLTRIGRSGIAAEEQIYHAAWAGRSVVTCRDRLRALVGAGLLGVAWTNARRPGERVYFVTPRGRAVLTAAQRARVRVGLAPRSEHKQQLLAQEYRLQLEAELAEEGGRLVDWADEREVKSAGARQAARAGAPRGGARWACADARAIVEHADGHRAVLAIEIDGAYYGARLARKMASLAAGVEPVVYVCAAARRAPVARAAAAYPTIRIVTV